MSSKDFLSWDDLPLEYILGEFTEDEDDCSGNSSDSCSEDAEEAVKVVKRRKKSFQCPDCPNTYGSISGFKGHVTKKHNKPHLKGM